MIQTWEMRDEFFDFIEKSTSQELREFYQELRYSIASTGFRPVNSDIEEFLVYGLDIIERKEKEERAKEKK